MATSFPGSGPGPGSDKTQAIPKTLLLWLILGVVAVVIVTGVVLTHNHGGTSAGQSGQPADTATGPRLGASGPMNGTTPTHGADAGAETSGQGGGPGAMGSGAGAGAGTPGTAGTRTSGASSGPPAGPSAGAPGTAP